MHLHRTLPRMQRLRRLSLAAQQLPLPLLPGSPPTLLQRSLLPPLPRNPLPTVPINPPPLLPRPPLPPPTVRVRQSLKFRTQSQWCLTTTLPALSPSPPQSPTPIPSSLLPLPQSLPPTLRPAPSPTPYRQPGQHISKKPLMQTLNLSRLKKSALATSKNSSSNAPPYKPSQTIRPKDSIPLPPPSIQPRR
jgi:hypothetical protein